MKKEKKDINKRDKKEERKKERGKDRRTREGGCWRRKWFIFTYNNFDLTGFLSCVVITLCGLWNEAGCGKESLPDKWNKMYCQLKIMF